MLKIKSVVPGDRPLISTGYKYNTGKVISLIATEDVGRKKEGVFYLSKYPKTFANVYIFPVDRPLVMSKFLGYLNAVDSHNESKQSDSALEKYLG